MLKLSFDPAPFRTKAADVRALETTLPAALHDGLWTATNDEKNENIVPVTPRSDIDHEHLQDHWLVTDHGDYVSIDNDTSYAGFVFQEPENAFGARVEKYHSREGRAALDAAPGNIRDRMEALVPEIVAKL